MDTKLDEKKQFLHNLVLSRKGRGSSTTAKPLFSEGGKSLIVCHNESCHMYNTSTGNHVKELFQCTSNIVSHHLHPVEHHLLITVTENGELTVYNLKTHEIENSLQLLFNHKDLNSKKVPKFKSSEHEEEIETDWELQSLDSLTHRKFFYAETKPFQGVSSQIMVWASWSLNDEEKAHISVFSLQEGKHNMSFGLKKCKLKKCYKNFVLSKSQENDLFLGISDHYLHIACYRNKDSYFYKSRKHFTGLHNTLHCAAFHPTEYSFATGDSSGRIIIWKNIFDKFPLKEIFHWHSMPVCDLVFTKFGNYLFSGGEENVLVKWSLVTKKKQFLPRLSSALHHIAEASDASLLSVSTSDGRILNLDFNFHSVSAIQNFSKWNSNQGCKNFSIFSVDPRSDSIVLNGKTGHIQFLSLRDIGKLLYTFDVTNRNFVTPHDTCSITNTEVTHAIFNSKGEWLITAENRKEKGCEESTLKFWKHNSAKNSFQLNTHIEFPHDGNEIYALEISLDNIVGTTGPDKRFCLWTLEEHQNGGIIKEMWSLYMDKKYRNLPSYALDFSKDSSLVAVTFGSIVTIWETNSCILKCSLSPPNSKDDLKVCKFCNNELTHLVITGTAFNVCCWNTLTLSMVWIVPFNLSILVSDPVSVYMASFSKDHTLVVFNPASPTPLLVKKNICNSPVIAGKCVLNGTGKFCLLFLTENQDLYCLEDTKSETQPSLEENTHSNITPFSAQLAQVQNKTDTVKKKSIPVLKDNRNSVSRLLNTPAHTLSNPSLLCSHVLKGLLRFSVDKPSSLRLSSTLKEENNLNKLSNENAEEVIAENKLLNFVESVFV